MVWGLLLVGLGVILLLGSIFEIDLGAFCWPIGLILVGVWLVLRPNTAPAGTDVNFLLLGDAKQTGEWQVQNKEYWVGVGDIDLDLIHANIPPGETVFKVYGFVGDLELFLPADVGFAVNTNGFVLDSEIFGRDYDSIFTSYDFTSDDYATAERKVRVEMGCFVMELKVRRL
jgi:hypothetical protein